jgi:hypothetical protein
MALPAVIAKLEDVAEPLRAHYVAAAEGKGFALDLTNAEQHPRLTTVSKTLEETRSERDAHAAIVNRLKEVGYNEEKWTQLQALASKDDLLKRIDEAGGFENLLKVRMADITTHHENTAKEWQKERAKLTAQVEQQEARRQREVLERAIRTEAKKLDCQPAAEDDIVRYLLNPNPEEPHWTVGEHDTVQARKADGKAPWYSTKDVNALLTVGEHLEALRPRKAGVWWASSGGAGTPPSRSEASLPPTPAGQFLNPAALMDAGRAAATTRS